MLFICCLPATMGEGCSYRFTDTTVNTTSKHTISLQSVKIKAVLKRQGCHSQTQTSADFLFQFQFSVSFAVNCTTSKRKGQRGVVFFLVLILLQMSPNPSSGETKHIYFGNVSVYFKMCFLNNTEMLVNTFIHTHSSSIPLFDTVSLQICTQIPPPLLRKGNTRLEYPCQTDIVLNIPDEGNYNIHVGHMPTSIHPSKFCLYLLKSLQHIKMIFPVLSLITFQ